MTETIESTASELVSTEVETAPAPSGLWRTDDPAEILQRAKTVADALAPVIREAGLVANISGKDYLNVEAWQVCGQQVGVTPVVTETRRVSDPDGWEARCEARTLDGRTIGAADSMCLRSEERWKDSDDFELRSMAQTRAMSRALASVLRFIPTLAGFSGTPAEEMQGRGSSKSGSSSAPSEKQLEFMRGLLKKAGGSQQTIDTIIRFAGENLTGGREGTCSTAIDALNSDASRQEEAKRLAADANEWLSRQSDVPADTDDLSENEDNGDQEFPPDD